MKRNIIHESENQIAWYCDVLKEEPDIITYSELVVPNKDFAVIPDMDYDVYVDIKKENLKTLTYEQIYLYLKNIQPDLSKKISRLDKFKDFLKGRNILFETGLFT